MKKISRKDLDGLTEMFLTYSETDMKKVVGGYTADQIQDYLLGYLGSSGTGGYDADGNYHWTSGGGYYYGSDGGNSSGGGASPNNGSDGLSVYDLESECVYEAVAALYGENMKPIDARVRYKQYLKSIGYSESEANSRSFGPVHSSHMVGFLNYVFPGHSTRQMNLKDKEAAIKNGTASSVKGVAVVGIHAVVIDSAIKTQDGNIFYSIKDAQGLLKKQGKTADVNGGTYISSGIVERYYDME